jgi:hypothetical protein
MVKLHGKSTFSAIPSGSIVHQHNIYDFFKTDPKLGIELLRYVYELDTNPSQERTQKLTLVSRNFSMSKAPRCEKKT